MNQNNLTQEVPETEATGPVADIYDDIRRTQQLPLVNLIWRHLATRPAALEWAWTIARPLYASGLARHAAERLSDEATLPDLPPVPLEATTALGLTSEDRDAIDLILRAYNRGNGPNLIALSAVLVSQEAIASSEAAPLPDSAPVELIEELPPLLALDQLAPDLQTLVVELNQSAVRGTERPIVATLYRHLGHWPPYLALAWAQLAPLHHSGRLADTVDEVQAAAEQLAVRAAHHRAPAPPTTPDADIEFARTAITHFRDTAICRMFTIGLLLARSIAPPAL